MQKNIFLWGNFCWAYTRIDVMAELCVKTMNVDALSFKYVIWNETSSYFSGCENPNFSIPKEYSPCISHHRDRIKHPLNCETFALWHFIFWTPDYNAAAAVLQTATNTWILNNNCPYSILWRMMLFRLLCSDDKSKGDSVFLMRLIIPTSFWHNNSLYVNSELSGSFFCFFHFNVK